MKPYSQGTLHCFSPPVMIATFCIEIAGALWTLWKYKANRASQLICLILVFLATFQFAEYMVCERAVFLSSLAWAKVGFASISMLPALGFHLTLELAQKKSRLLLGLGYAFALSFAAFFLIIAHGIASSQCTGNYVIFQMMPNMMYFYAFYYHVWLVIGISMAFKASREGLKNATSLLYLGIGYASFMLPTTIVYLIDPTTIAGIPSIMCGFAVLLALCLIFAVLPNIEGIETNERVWVKKLINQG